ncbi:MAG: PEP-CTERM sorting domain-containing protein [Thermoguttaceae bacterium]|nr:PEP-CTERM sorting domain-containing protein [Thermoguttaceae bacterium]MDW8038034.1 PEP-CTERM sorting domain-containing protein [Thermoguttaceae bacterium]
MAKVDLQKFFFFGDGTGIYQPGSESLWACVRFETGQYIYVPEPSSAVLAGLAGLGVGAAILFRRKNCHRRVPGKRQLPHQPNRLVTLVETHSGSPAGRQVSRTDWVP